MEIIEKKTSVENNRLIGAFFQPIGKRVDRQQDVKIDEKRNYLF